MKLKWKRPPMTSTDKALEKNGAYKRPEVYTLCDPKGNVHGRVLMVNGEWRYIMPGEAMGPPMAGILAAKARVMAKAQAAIRAKALAA